MSLVTVICPGARRCNIKVTPNTVLLQILEQACSKQKLDPDLYIFKHHNKKLDLSLPLRYSGVPNNGKLELVKAETPRKNGGEVVVAIQCADGTRVQSTFQSSSSLWEVLSQHKLDASPDGMEPSLTYMRQESSGEATLRLKTLRDVGLSSGRGVMRLMYRPVSEGAQAAVREEREEHTHVEPPESSGVGQEEGKRRTEGTREDEEEGGKEGGVEREEEGEGEEKERSKLERVAGEEAVAEMRTNDFEETPRPKPPPREEAMDTEEELPYFPAHPISYFPPDAEVEEQDKTLETTPPPSPPHPLPMQLDTQPAAALLIQQTLQQQSHVFPPEVVAAQLEELQSSQFAGYSKPRPQATPMFPVQPRVYDEPCEREMVVYHLDDSMPLTPVEEVPDSFFEHTVTDLHVMHSDLKKQAKTSDAPLMTRAMREVKEEMKLEKYKKSIVRVYFPDRWVLQATFRPRESLKMLVRCIRENLADPQVKFHLYTAPPKHVLRSGRITFAEAGFIPAAIVHVGVEEGCPPPQLSQTCLQSALSALHAEIVQTRERRASSGEGAASSTQPQDPSPTAKPKPSQPSLPAESRPRETAVPNTQGGRKVPKWFKIGH